MEDAGRVALITYGTGSFGKASSLELARRGWSVFLQHVGQSGEVSAACEAILKAGKDAGKDIQVSARQADITSAAGREELVEQALEELGRLDMLVNCPSARTGQSCDLLELGENDFMDAMHSHPAAVFFLTQHVANEMVRLVEAGDIENPRIVTINTINSYTTSSDLGMHCIGSAATSMITQLFADRLGEHGINVYEIRMGIIAAGAADASHARYDQLISAGLTPIRRWGRPGDVARAVAAIAEDLLGFSTGEVINVDGGFHLRRM